MNENKRFLEIERRMLEAERFPLKAMREMLAIHAKANK